MGYNLLVSEFLRTPQPHRIARRVLAVGAVGLALLSVGSACRSGQPTPEQQNNILRSQCLQNLDRPGEPELCFKEYPTTTLTNIRR